MLEGCMHVQRGNSGLACGRFVCLQQSLLKKRSGEPKKLQKFDCFALHMKHYCSVAEWALHILVCSNCTGWPDARTARLAAQRDAAAGKRTDRSRRPRGWPGSRPRCRLRCRRCRCRHCPPSPERPRSHRACGRLLCGFECKTAHAARPALPHAGTTTA